ncbi:S8 family serine peptidase [Microbacterium sp.]|uniref:S8 family serine peptidase n=1 Tax=Microbacterium sp. TaxID=51671 RepID=UPI00260EECBA|nr:S8 family serine peptidase [Microbacterium sp.]
MTAAASSASCAENADAPVIAAASWGQRHMGAERAWPRTTGDVIVAVVDTGVSANTPSLRGAVLRGSDLSGGRGDVDCFGRGTFIASLIASRAASDTEFVGVAPGATILPIRAINHPEQRGLDTELPGLLTAAINASVAAGARVIAVPLSTTVNDKGLNRAVKAAVDKDVLIVASAIQDEGLPTFPASWEGVLAVAPLGLKGGAVPEQLGASPDVASPSHELIGAVPDGPGHIEGTDDALAVGYAAAAAALVMDAYPELSVQEVSERLIGTADATTASSAPGERDPSLGYGVVNPVAAVTRLGTETIVVTPTPAVTTLGLAPGPDERPVDLAVAVTAGAGVLAISVIGPTVGVILVRRKHVAE